MHLKSLIVLLLLSLPLSYVNADPPLEKDGTLVTLVTWGDVDNTPAKDVYVEAHGYVAGLKAEKSFVLKMMGAGRYETSLPPGIYDVFISEGSSAPRCKRVQIRPKFQTYRTVKLEIDDVYINKN